MILQPLYQAVPTPAQQRNPNPGGGGGIRTLVSCASVKTFHERSLLLGSRASRGCGARLPCWRCPGVALALPVYSPLPPHPSRASRTRNVVSRNAQGPGGCYAARAPASTRRRHMAHVRRVVPVRGTQLPCVCCGGAAVRRCGGCPRRLALNNAYRGERGAGGCGRQRQSGIPGARPRRPRAASSRRNYLSLLRDYKTRPSLPAARATRYKSRPTSSPTRP